MGNGPCPGYRVLTRLLVHHASTVRWEQSRTPGEEAPVDMRHMVETHWTEQRSEDQLDFLDED